MQCNDKLTATYPMTDLPSWARALVLQGMGAWVQLTETLWGAHTGGAERSTVDLRCDMPGILPHYRMLY